MGNDRPDDADASSDEHSDQPADRTDAARSDSEHSDQPDSTQAETRDRGECYSDLHAAVTNERQGEAGERWDECAQRFREEWADHLRRWPAAERTPVDRSDDPPGSWRGDSDRFLDKEDNCYVEEWCDWIAKVERDIVSPTMRAIESQDSERHLSGFGDRLKGRDRVKDKTAAEMEENGRTAREAVSMVKDAMRFTFTYREESYTEGVSADLARMSSAGFIQVERKNSWKSDQYKGINSRWLEPTTGQLFEVQFHSEISFEAKQITHKAYERLRDTNTSRAELRELRSFQRGVCERIPIPPGAADIPDYP